MIKKYNEHIAYLNDDIPSDDIKKPSTSDTLELVGLPSGLYFEIKRSDYHKVQRYVTWSDKYDTHVYLDNFYDKLLNVLGIDSPSPIDNDLFIVDKLKEMGIKNYKISNNKVEVFQDVLIQHYLWKKLPIKFTKAHGDFIMIKGHLETLENFPDKIYGNFNISYNKLKTLKGGPKMVDKNYDCSHNNLIDLYGSPMEVFSFNCSYNKLQSLKYGPSYIHDTFDCSNNELKNILEAPVIVNNLFIFKNNPDLKSLKGWPRGIKSSIGLN